jgi:hypothetical protein
MESLVYQLISYIKAKMPALMTVDEDYGQLEAIDSEDKDTYPVVFPAVLLNPSETEWSSLEGKSQKGKAIIIVKLIIDCYDDTHAGSGTLDSIKVRADTIKELHQLLQCYRPDGDGEMIREKSRFYTWSHGLKVYEMHYSVSVTEKIMETVTTPKPKVTISARKL